MKIKHIKYIPIGGEKYRIVWDTEGLTAVGSVAEFRPLVQEIGLHPIMQGNSLEIFKSILHESMHGIEKFMAFRIDDIDLERLAQGLGAMLVETGIVDPDKLKFG